jgi:hypothetical protein
MSLAFIQAIENADILCPLRSITAYRVWKANNWILHHSVIPVLMLAGDA